MRIPPFRERSGVVFRGLAIHLRDVRLRCRFQPAVGPHIQEETVNSMIYVPEPFDEAQNQSTPKNRLGIMFSTNPTVSITAGSIRKGRRYIAATAVTKATIPSNTPASSRSMVEGT